MSFSLAQRRRSPQAKEFTALRRKLGLTFRHPLDHLLSMHPLARVCLRRKLLERPKVDFLVVGMILLALCCFAVARELEVLPYPPSGQVPAGYPPEYAAVIRAAEDEGKLIIYSNTDARPASELIEDFQQVYPKIAVDYQDLNST